MLSLEHHFGGSVNDDLRKNSLRISGLFLEESAPALFVSLISPKKNSIAAAAGCSHRRSRRRGLGGCRRRSRGFISLTLSSINGDGGGGGRGRCGEELSVSSVLGNVGEKNVESENEDEKEVLVLKEVVREEKNGGSGGGTFNTAKHLWAGAVAAMVSRFVLFLLSLPFPLTFTVFCYCRCTLISCYSLCCYKLLVQNIRTFSFTNSVWLESMFVLFLLSSPLYISYIQKVCKYS